LNYTWPKPLAAVGLNIAAVNGGPQ